MRHPRARKRRKAKPRPEPQAGVRVTLHRYVERFDEDGNVVLADYRPPGPKERKRRDPRTEIAPRIFERWCASGHGITTYGRKRQTALRRHAKRRAAVGAPA